MPPPFLSMLPPSSPQIPIECNVILCDGAFMPYSSRAAMAAMLLSGCSLFDGVGKVVAVYLALVAEAWALRQASLIA